MSDFVLSIFIFTYMTGALFVGFKIIEKLENTNDRSII